MLGVITQSLQILEELLQENYAKGTKHTASKKLEVNIKCCTVDVQCILRLLQLGDEDEGLKH